MGQMDGLMFMREFLLMTENFWIRELCLELFLEPINMVEGKVAKGKVEDDDRVAVWTDGLSQKLERGRLTELDEAGVSLLNESIKTENLAAAGLVLDFQKLVREEVEGSFEKMIVVSEKKADEVAKLDLADERYV